MEAGMVPVRKLLGMFVETQRTRVSRLSRIDNLTVLVRRYWGMREREAWHRDGDDGSSGPDATVAERKMEIEMGLKTNTDRNDEGQDPESEYATHLMSAHGTFPKSQVTTNPRPAPDEPAEIPYCADKYLDILNPLRELGPIIDGVCIVGASQAWTTETILHLWKKATVRTHSSHVDDQKPFMLQPTPAEVAAHCYQRMPSRVYPSLPGQRSALNWGAGIGVSVFRHPRKWFGLYGYGSGTGLSPRLVSQGTFGREVSQADGSGSGTGGLPMIMSRMPALRDRALLMDLEKGRVGGGGVTRLRHLVKKASRDVLNRRFGFMKT
jgi:hypothetical protein